MKAPTTLLVALSLAVSVTVSMAALAGPDQRAATPATDKRDARQQEQARPSPNPQQQPRRKIDADRGRQYHLTPHIRRYYASARS